MSLMEQNHKSGRLSGGARLRLGRFDTSSVKSEKRPFECSHVVRLSGRQWLFVAVVLLAVVGWGPTVWDRFESFQPDSDYRLPYELSSDY